MLWLNGSLKNNMSGIDRAIYLKNRTSLIDKHLPDAEKSQRELETEGIVSRLA